MAWVICGQFFRQVAPKAFFAANTMVGWVGGFYEKWPTTNFWLLHAAFAGLCFVLFKFIVSRHLEAETG